jgi:hypothetical protein
MYAARAAHQHVRRLMTLLFNRSTLWPAINFAGMALYLYLASDLWVYPGKGGEPGGPGDAFYWLFILVPILVAYSAINLVALITIVRRIRSTKNTRPLVFWLVIAVFWVVTVIYDHHRAFRVVDEKYSFAHVTSTTV